MVNIRPEIAITALLLLVLIIIASAALRHRAVPARGRGFIYFGFALLIIGNLFYIFDPFVSSSLVSLMELSEIEGTLHQLICLRAGLVFLGIGVLRMVPDVAAVHKSKKLLERATESNQQLQLVQGLLNSILRSSLAGTMVLKPVRSENGEITDFEYRLVNRAAEQILGRSAEQLIGGRLLVDFPCLAEHAMFDDAVSTMDTGLPFIGERSCRNGGTDRCYQISAVRHGDCLTITFADVTDRRRIEDQLQYSALHDTLTGLANRSLLLDRLDQSINRGDRDPDYKFAVLFLDFDRFKLINDSFGHHIGDELLISIADRLRGNLRAIDTFAAAKISHIPARLGGDEFVVLLDDIKEICNASIVAERLQRDLAKPHRIGGHELISTASIGIVTNERPYARSEEILRDADTAMYHAKQAGKDCHVIFTRDMHHLAHSRLELENELRDAIERKAFILEFQPIVSLSAGHITGMEALIRWPHPHRGLIPPDHFVSVAEELGIIVPMGEWVLRQACQVLQRLQVKSKDGPPLSMNVNLSKTELCHVDLIPMVKRVLKTTGVDPETVRLEITESSIMGDWERLKPILDHLKELGVKLVMDDFGTGHSSLSCLDQLPFDVLKIDQSFVKSDRKKRETAAILNSIVALAHNLSMPVVAEGIETEDQLTMVQALECDYGQGWLFGESISADNFETLLSRTSTIRAAA